MALPGFTAENALRHSPETYRAAVISDHQIFPSLAPQMRMPLLDCSMCRDANCFFRCIMQFAFK